MPMPEDMPFLLRLSLEGIKHTNTDKCGQILIVGDGFGHDRGTALKNVAEEFSDPRIEMVLFSHLDRAVVRQIGDVHWLTVIYGTNSVRYAYAFLHDADAFFLDRDCIEQTFRYCVDNGVYTTGVDARWDPFYERIGYQIPGTWQMMFSVSWLRRHKPWMVRGRILATPHGINTFDTLLYPQYLDYSSGKVGVMPNAPKYVHFSGTIATYRAWKRANGRHVVDELFRLLLLSILEHILPAADGKRLLPRMDDLALGLKDSTCPIRYDTLDCAKNYGQFRVQISELCGSSVFAGARAESINSLLLPFDSHFAKIALEMGDELQSTVRKFRINGLG